MKNKKTAHNIFIIAYWTAAALFFFIFLFFLIRSYFHQFVSSRLSEIEKGYREELETFLSDLENSICPAEWWDLDHAPEPALQSLKTFRLPNNLQGEFYFCYYDRSILLSHSCLPVGHPMITSISDNQTLHTPVYQRSSDGSYVISFFRTIDSNWALAVDIPVTSIAAYLQNLQRPAQFFYLIDERSNRVIACPDSHSLGYALEEKDTPFFKTLSTFSHLTFSDLTVTDEQGNLYYGTPRSIERLFSPMSFWLVVSYCSHESVMKEFSKTVPSLCLENWGLAALYLIVAGLIWGLIQLRTS